MSSSSSTSQPPWLASVLQDHSPAPRIYSWTPPGHPDPRRVAAALDPRHIHVLGVGNLGRLYATSIAQLPDPPPVTLILHRQQLLADWEAGRGIEITRPDGVVETDNKSSFDVEYWTEEPPTAAEGGTTREIGPVGNLIIGTKASLAIPEMDRLRRYLGAQSTVAFAQNGMNALWPPHGESYIAHRYGEGEAVPSFVHCITGHGLINVGPFRSRHTAIADVKCGPVLPNGTGVESYLLGQIAAAPHLAAVTASRGDLWALQLEKLVFNTVINPLTAILRVKNGALFTSQDGPLVAIIDRLLSETSAVYRSLVRHPSTTPIISSPDGDIALARRRLEARFDPAALRSILWSFGLRVGANNSSMLQDVVAGRPTEIRELNGWVVDMARFLDMDTSTSTSTSTNAELELPSPQPSSIATATAAAVATDGANGASGTTTAITGNTNATPTAGDGVGTRPGATRHVVSAHERLIYLVESGQVLDQEQLARVILGS